MKASDIPDVDMVAAVHAENLHVDGSAIIWNVVERFSRYPPKVVIAKLRKLDRRGLIAGCTCGCRGDFCLMPEGARLIETPLYYHDGSGGWTRFNPDSKPV